MKHLIDWVESNGGWVSSKVQVKEVVLPSGEVCRGIYAGSAISEGETLLKIPSCLTIFATPNDIRAVSGSSSSSAENDSDMAGDVWYLSLARALQRSTQSELFSPFSHLIDLYDSACPLQTELGAFPRPHPQSKKEVSTDDLPDRFFECLAETSPLAQWILGWRSFMKAKMGQVVQNNGKEEGSQSGVDTNQEPSQIAQWQYMRAVRYCLSHAHTLCDSGRPDNKERKGNTQANPACIVPFADLFNHASVGNVQRVIEWRGSEGIEEKEEGGGVRQFDCIKFVTRHQVVEGDELFFSYDSWHPSSNDLFLHQYGFIPAKNGADNVMLDFRAHLSDISGKADKSEVELTEKEKKKQRALKVVKLLQLQRSSIMDHGTCMGPKGFVPALPNGLYLAALLTAKTVPEVMEGASNIGKGSGEDGSVSARLAPFYESLSECSKRMGVSKQKAESFATGSLREEAMKKVFIQYLDEKERLSESIRREVASVSKAYVEYQHTCR
mmetsp:Transcript_47082/g.121625  ORF Transcript_47082/g.121625 Transcript_47082/m.121625 type:complete len:497 (-) Transcript_47082:400-1890(-)